MASNQGGKSMLHLASQARNTVHITAVRYLSIRHPLKHTVLYSLAKLHTHCTYHSPVCCNVPYSLRPGLSVTSQWNASIYKKPITDRQSIMLCWSFYDGGCSTVHVHVYLYRLFHYSRNVCSKRMFTNSDLVAIRYFVISISPRLWINIITIGRLSFYVCT